MCDLGQFSNFFQLILIQKIKTCLIIKSYFSRDPTPLADFHEASLVKFFNPIIFNSNRSYIIVLRNKFPICSKKM